jgi:hypothetical protein
MSVPSVRRIAKLPLVSNLGFVGSLMTIPYGSDYILVAYSGIYRVGSSGTTQLFPVSGAYPAITFAKYIYPYELLFSFTIPDNTYGLGILDLNTLQIQYKTYTSQESTYGYYLVPISDTDWILYTYNNVYYVSLDDTMNSTMNQLPITFKYTPKVSITKYIVTMDVDPIGNPYYALYELDYKSGTIATIMDIPQGLSPVNATAACTITPSTGPQFCDQSAAFTLVDTNGQYYLMYYNIDTLSFDIMPLGVIDIPTSVLSTYYTPPFRHFKYQNIFVMNNYIIDVNAKRVYDVYDLINKQSPLDDDDMAENYTMTVVQNPDSFQVAFAASSQPPSPPQLIG